MGILLSLSSLLSWTFSDLLAKKTLQKQALWFISFWGQLFGGIAILAIGIFMGEIQSLAWESWPWVLLLSVLNVFGMFCFYKAIQSKGVALSLPVIYSWSIPSIFLGMIFLDQFPSTLQWLGVCGAIFGIFLVSVDTKAKHWVDKGTLYAFLSMLTWAIFYFLIREPSQVHGEWFLSSGIKIGSALFALPFLFKEGHSLSGTLKNLSWSLGLIGVLDALGLIFLTTALQISSTAIVTGIISTTPVVVAFFGVFLFKEKVTHQQKLGILISTIGLILLVIPR